MMPRGGIHLFRREYDPGKKLVIQIKIHACDKMFRKHGMNYFSHQRVHINTAAEQRTGLIDFYQRHMLFLKVGQRRRVRRSFDGVVLFRELLFRRVANRTTLV